MAKIKFCLALLLKKTVDSPIALIAKKERQLLLTLDGMGLQ